jgi:Domain of unknown function (DUF4274)
MSAIQEQFYPADDFGPGERAYLLELGVWLQAQPHDAWLMFARTMNWDSMEDVAAGLIDDPDCDLSVVAALFWPCDPAFWVTRPQAEFESTFGARILKNVRDGFYPHSQLAYGEDEFMPWVLAFRQARHGLGANEKPFDVPARLFGPFVGRDAKLDPRPDGSTVAHLKEIYRALGVYSDRNWFEQ